MFKVAIIVALLLPATATATPDGFRFSKPLTERAVKLSGDKRIGVYCAKSQRAWRDSATTDQAADSTGRAYFRVWEIHLPPSRCAPLERWLKGKRVDRVLLANALFTLAHEVGHLDMPTRDELDADCYATRKYNVLARLFGVKSKRTLQSLRVEAPLIPSLC